MQGTGTDQFDGYVHCVTIIQVYEKIVVLVSSGHKR